LAQFLAIFGGIVPQFWPNFGTIFGYFWRHCGTILADNFWRINKSPPALRGWRDTKIVGAGTGFSVKQPYINLIFCVCQPVPILPQPLWQFCHNHLWQFCHTKKIKGRRLNKNRDFFK